MFSFPKANTLLNYLIILLFILLSLSCTESPQKESDSKEIAKRESDHTKTDFAKKVKLHEVNPIPYKIIKEKNILSITETAYFLKEGEKRLDFIFEYDLRVNKLVKYWYIGGKNYGRAEFIFDEKGKQLSMVGYNGKKLIEWYSYYNNDGVLIKMEQFLASGEKSGENVYEYDSLNYTLIKTRKDLLSDWEYDSYLKFDEKGNLIEIPGSDSTQKIVFEYDSLGNIESEVKYNKDVVGYTCKYIYDNNGLLTERITYGVDQKPKTKTLFEYSDKPSDLIVRGMEVKNDGIEYSTLNSKEEIQSDFKRWLFKNTAITEVRFESDWQIWVTLEPYKYTNEDNVEQIAETIARWYAQKMDKDFTACTVWRGKEIYTKGNYKR